MLKKFKETLWRIWQWIKLIWIYPVTTIRPGTHFDYNSYWKEKRGSKYMGSLGGWQMKRAIIASRIISASGGGSLNDIGSGAGEVSKYIRDHTPINRVVAYDSSSYALAFAKEVGFEVKLFDMNNENDYSKLEATDYTIMFEILEHIPGPEALLKQASETSKKGLMFSVPNTGFVIHRLRLLFGKFPLEWRRHPSEHLRFWTRTDLVWWLNVQGYRYVIYDYAGVPIFKDIWPNMFAAGLFVEIIKD
jgi:2-polyprenyl-3-methyl-5-hydroxy-6-metoxy-1,4-benzoquinol methylase